MAAHQSLDIKLNNMARDIKDVKDSVDELKEDNKTRFAHTIVVDRIDNRLKVVEKIVFGLVAIILAGVTAGVLRLVIV